MSRLMLKFAAFGLAFGLALGLAGFGALAQAAYTIYAAGEGSSIVKTYSSQTDSSATLIATGNPTPGEPFKPEGLAVNGTGVYVASRTSPTFNVLRYTSSGSFVSNYVTGLPSAAQGLRFGPDNNLYIGAGSSGVYKFDTTSNILTQHIPGGVGFFAGRINFGPDGNLYVPDLTDNSVRKYTIGGTSLGSFSVPGDPFDIAWGPDGNIYLTQYGLGRVEKYSPTGTSLGTFVNVAGAYSVLFAPDNTVFVSSYDGNVVKQFVASGVNAGNFIADKISIGGPAQLALPEPSAVMVIGTIMAGVAIRRRRKHEAV